MAGNDDKLQALGALQCDGKWLSRGHARAGGFSLMLGRAHAAALQRSGTGSLASSCEIATTSLDLSRYSSPQLGQAPERAGPSASASREREAWPSSCLSGSILPGNGDDVQAIASSSSYVHQ